jgi:hypothetical protein
VVERWGVCRDTVPSQRDHEPVRAVAAEQGRWSDQTAITRAARARVGGNDGWSGRVQIVPDLVNLHYDVAHKWDGRISTRATVRILTALLALDRSRVPAMRFDVGFMAMVRVGGAVVGGAGAARGACG